MKSTIILRQPTNDIYFLKHSMHNNLLSFGGGTWTTTSFPQSAQLILYDFGRIERPSLEPRCLPCLLICAISTSFLLFVYCLSQPFDSRPEGWSLPSARGFGLSVRLSSRRSLGRRRMGQLGLITISTAITRSSSMFPSIPGSSLVRARMRFIHIHLLAKEFLPVKILNCRLALSLVRHFYKTKSSRLATIFVLNDCH